MTGPTHPAMRFRAYGASGPLVVVLHGGPGAPGSVAAVARRLGESFRVLESFQRRSGGEPLTVARHVADLHELLHSRHRSPRPGRTKGEGQADDRPALVGHSWGAMLALAYAAAHPGSVAALVLIGCGTFDLVAREHMRQAIDRRMDDALRQRLERLAEEAPDPDARLSLMGDLLLPLYSHDLVADDHEDAAEAADACGHHETWEDMLRLQEAGVYPGAFRAIHVPVLMLHGAADPHPGRMIRAILQPFLPQLEYREFERCGHYPWLERAAREEFHAVLREWLGRRLA